VQAGQTTAAKSGHWLFLLFGGNSLFKISLQGKYHKRNNRYHRELCKGASGRLFFCIGTSKLYRYAVGLSYVLKRRKKF
jgi:hypothetical protein